MSEFAQSLSEPVRGTGATGGDIPIQVLKSSSTLGKWTVFIRETFQNSNDQRLGVNSHLGFAIRLREVPKDGSNFLKATFKRSGPFNSDTALGLGSSSRFKKMLLVIDTNTKGLSGERDPRKSSVEQSNFNNFFYFTGQMVAKKSGGGTFGIGRNVLFGSSKYRTILAYSVFKNNGSTERVLQGMSVSKQFDHDGFRYTGKHWWGEGSAQEEAESISPFTGEDAREIAKKFDIDRYLENTTGTVIVVLEPDMSDEKLELQEMADSILVHLWPHLVKESGKKPNTTIEVWNEGEQILIPEPDSSESVVRPFVLAYNEAKRGSSVHEVTLTYRGRLDHLKEFETVGRDLGQVRWRIDQSTPDLRDPDLQDRYQKLGFVPENSIALMRKTKIIVHYYPTPKPIDGTSIAGIFRASPDYEQVFRKSENATHDTWTSTPLNLGRGMTDPIKQFWSKLAELFATGSSVGPIDSPVDGFPMLAADTLGNLIAGLGVTGGSNYSNATKKTSKTPAFGTSRKISFDSIDQPRIASRTKTYCEGTFSFSPTRAGKPDSKYRLALSAKVWLGDKFEDSPPESDLGIDVRLIRIRKNAKEEFIDHDLDLPLSSDYLDTTAEYEILVRYPTNVQVACSIQAIEENA